MLRVFASTSSSSAPLTRFSSSSSALLFSAVRAVGRTGVGAPPSSTQVPGRRSGSSSWTNLLDEDEAELLHKKAGSLRGTMEQAAKHTIRAGTPAELQHTITDEDGHASRKRVMPRFGEVPTADGGVAPSAESAAAGGAGAGAADAAPSSSWLNVFKRRKPQQEQLSEEEEAERQRPRVSAVSRFFRDAEARERASRHFEDDDMSRHGSPFKSPTMTRDSATGEMTLEQKEGEDPTSVAAHRAGDGKKDGRVMYHDEAETPYDAYRNLGGGMTSSGMKKQDALNDDKMRAQQSFMPGLGMAQSALQFAIDKGTQDGQVADMPKDYAIRRPQMRDRKMTFRRRVFADFDPWDRRSTTHVLTSYNSSEWIFAFVSVMAIYYLTEYQFRYAWLSWYDELLGVDMKALGDKSSKSEWMFILGLTLICYRMFLFHPMALGVIAWTRGCRYIVGLPLGPP